MNLVDQTSSAGASLVSISRRRFLRLAGASGLAISASQIVGCARHRPRARLAEVDRGARPGPDLLYDNRVLILGDSITQNGLWVSFLEHFARTAQPSKSVDIISIGLASETVSGVSEPGHAGGAFPRPCVHERLGRALNAAKPSTVIACYGMNDGGYLPYSKQTLEKFQRGMFQLVSTCRNAGARVLLITPPAFDYSRAPKNSSPPPDPSYNDTLRRFSALLVKELPSATLGVLDLHMAMSSRLEVERAKNPAFRFADDGVHPTELGHLYMAGFIWAHLSSKSQAHNHAPPISAALPIDELVTPSSAELRAITDSPVFQMVHRRRQLRSEAWLNYIGYTRERTVPPGTDNIIEQEAVASEMERTILTLLRQ